MYLIDNTDTVTPIGTLMSNTHLHPRVAVITPPEIIPAAKPEPVAAAKTLRARFLSLPSGKAAARIDSPVAEAIAAPSPWTTLARIKTISEEANLLSTR